VTRERLDEIIPGFTRKFKITYTDELTEEVKQLRFYVTANMFSDGRIAEVFIRGDKIGGLLGGALDTWAIMFNMAMQHGIPMAVITDKLRYQRFGPAGRTGEEELKSCTSMFDLIAQWLDKDWPNGRRRVAVEEAP